VFTARYALSPYIKQIRFVFKGLIVMMTLQSNIVLNFVVFIIAMILCSEQKLNFYGVIWMYVRLC
jgi:diacylglycerol kinase